MSDATVRSNPSQPRSDRSCAARMAAAAGSLAVISGLPTAASATVIHVTGAPVVLNNPPGGETVLWDLDGDSTVDFEFRARFEPGNVYYEGATIGSLAPLGANQATNDGSDLRALPDGFSVGQSLAAYTWSGAERDLVYNYSTSIVSWVHDVAGFTYQYVNYQASYVGRVGVSFEAADGTHYGWASFQLDVTPGWRVTITEWAYEDIANRAIAVGATSTVPEPELPSLALLAAGAVGVRAWRRRRAARAE